MEGMSYILFLDDVRAVPDWIKNDPLGYKVCRSAYDFVHCLKDHGCPQHIAFDHDLGLESLGTGYDMAKEFGNEILSGEFLLPAKFSYSVHSANPVGAENIRTYMQNLIAECTKRGLIQGTEDQRPS
jgi:hypothetical protein